MAVALSPVFQPDTAEVDPNGKPRSGAKLFTYVAGSTTKVTVFKDSAGTVTHTNPIILDSNGLSPAAIWLNTGASVKFVLAPPTDTDPPTSPILTIDNISGVNDATGTQTGEWTASGLTPTFISGTSFTVPGDQTTVLEVNRRIRSTDSGGTDYSTITKSVFTTLTTLTVELDSGALDSGLSSFSYGILSTGNTSLPFNSQDQQCARLTLLSTTQIRLDPENGNTIWVFTGGFWRRRTIPTTGISAANTSIFVDGVGGSNLVASSTYFVYLFDNAGVLTFDFSFTGYVVQAISGLKVKSAVNTRLFIGIARTNTSSQYQLVVSQYSRRDITLKSNFTVDRSTTSATIVEINSEIRVPFLTFSDESISAQFSSFGSNNTTGSGGLTYITIDGISSISSVTADISSAANSVYNTSLAIQNSPSEGFHFMTIGGNQTNGGTATWAGGNTDGRSTLFVKTRG